MKLGKVMLAAALAVTFGFGLSARADSSLSLSASAITVNNSPPNILTATNFYFRTAVGGNNTMYAGLGTGIFSSIPLEAIIGTTDLDLTASGGVADPYLTLSYSGYQFVADSLVGDTTEGPPNVSRVVDLTGYINGPSFTNLAASFTLSFNQTGGVSASIGYGGSLDAVPEPASVAMLAMGGLGLGAVALRRRARSRA